MAKKATRASAPVEEVAAAPVVQPDPPAPVTLADYDAMVMEHGLDALTAEQQDAYRALLGMAVADAERQLMESLPDASPTPEPEFIDVVLPPGPPQVPAGGALFQADVGKKIFLSLPGGEVRVVFTSGFYSTVDPDEIAALRRYVAAPIQYGAYVYEVTA